MQIKEFIKENTHLTNEELILKFVKIAYNKGWENRDGNSIEESIPDIIIRDEWLKSLL